MRRFDPVLARLHATLDTVIEVAPALEALVRDVRAGLAAPPRVAVAGRVKAGKSTLVNALVGRRVAPTRAGECTQVVTTYRHGSPDRAELVLRDGTRRPVRWEGALPEDLDVPAEQVDHLEVHLQAGRLRGFTLIDTPGLSTTTLANDQATRRALLSAEASHVDALLYVVRDVPRQDDAEFLAEYRAVTAGLGPGAGACLGVLSHADTFGGGPWAEADALETAAEAARRLAVSQAGAFLDVLPVSGLLAETARTGRLRESDARVLARLADADPGRLRLWHHLGAPPGVDAPQLTRLTEMLGLYGLRHARGLATRGTDQVLTWAEQASGIARVERALCDRMLGRGRLLAAARALDQLRDLARGTPSEAAVATVVEEARCSADLHLLDVLQAHRDLQRVDPTGPLAEDLTRLLDAPDDRAAVGLPPRAAGADVAVRAAELSAEAHARRPFVATPVEDQGWRTLARGYLIIARRGATSRP